MFQKFNFQQNVSKNKVVVLISSIITLLLGVLCIITPYAAGAVLIWVFIGLGNERKSSVIQLPR